MKVLIITPHPKSQGGISEYYKLFKKHKDELSVDADFIYTNRKVQSALILRVLDTLIVFCKYMYILHRYDIIQVNISIGWWSGMIRDIAFNFIAKYLFLKKTVFFFHGWDTNKERDVFKYKKTTKFFLKADLYIVLARKFNNSLVDLGIHKDLVVREITPYEKLHATPSPKRDIKNILFIARFAKNKGCLIVLHIFKKLVIKYPELKLYMVGDGEMTEKIITYISTNQLVSNVIMTGFINGTEKTEILNKCDLLLFPTEHTEGFPLSIVESMAHGLIILSNSSGGIPDIIINGENGFVISENNEFEFLSNFEKLYHNKELIYKISSSNIKYAKINMEIQKVIERFNIYYTKLAQND